MTTFQSSESRHERFVGSLAARRAERRDAATLRRRKRDEQRRLDAQLAAYTSPSDLAELYAIAHRASAAGSDELLEAVARVH